jgi:hypothetical protein
LDDPILISRWQFAFTIVYHYLFPALTMGLAGLVFVLKSIYMRNRNEIYNKSARFWARSSRLPSSWAWSPVSPWSSSSGPTGRCSPPSPVA